METRAHRAGRRIDPALVVAVALAFGAVAALSPWLALGTGAVVIGLLARWLPPWARLAAALALALGWARAASELAAFDAAHAEARALFHAPERCAFAARVATQPAERAGTLRFVAEAQALDCGARVLPGPRELALQGPPQALARGDEIAVIADIGPLSLYRNFDVPDPRPSLARRGPALSGSFHWLEVTQPGSGIAALVDRARAHVRRRIDASYPALVRGMARALVLGESDLDARDERAFAASGLSHLLAVSGTHLIFAVLALVRGVEAVLRRSEALAGRFSVRRVAAVVGLVLAPAYADFAGGSGSAWRAAWMMLAVLGVRALGRHVFASRVVAASLTAGWLDAGLVVFDLSFLLSIAATAGLLTFGGVSADARASAAALTVPRVVDPRRLLSAVASASTTTLAATLPCLPILLLLAPGVTMASVGANLLAGPLAEAVALPLCLTHACLAPLPSLERGMALVAGGALAVIRAIAHAAASVPWLFVELPPPSGGHFAALAVGAGAWLAAVGRPWLAPAAPAAADAALQPWSARARAVAALLVAAALTGAELLARWPHSAAHGARAGRLRVTALDVGQGDATLVDLPDGRLMLIDAGGTLGRGLDPGDAVIVPALRARRRTHLDIVVLTHPHPDHYGGLPAVTEAVSVGELWYAAGARGDGLDPRRTSADGDAGGVLPGLLERLRARGVRLRDARELCREGVATRGYAIDVLAPCPDVAPEQSANDNSLVLRIRASAGAALFLGDAERWAEARLVEARPRQLAADFMKVGHHGSRSSTSPELLALVRPRVASISCGLRNRFGHPHAETLEALAGAGVRVLRTDRSGAVQWEASRGAPRVRSVWPE